MKMNIQVDLSELFLAAQDDALDNANVESEEWGVNVTSGHEFDLKDEIKADIIKQAVGKVNTSVIHKSLSDHQFSPDALMHKFDIMAQQRMALALDSKVDQWSETEIVISNDRYSFAKKGESVKVDDLLEAAYLKSIDNLVSKHGQKSLAATIDKITDDKVEAILAKYEAQIQERVDVTASALIQKQVQETLTSTFTMLMKAGNNPELLESK